MYLTVRGEIAFIGQGEEDLFMIDASSLRWAGFLARGVLRVAAHPEGCVDRGEGLQWPDWACTASEESMASAHYLRCVPGITGHRGVTHVGLGMAYISTAVQDPLGGPAGSVRTDSVFAFHEGEAAALRWNTILGGHH